MVGGVVVPLAVLIVLQLAMSKAIEVELDSIDAVGDPLSWAVCAGEGACAADWDNALLVYDSARAMPYGVLSTQKRIVTTKGFSLGEPLPTGLLAQGVDHLRSAKTALNALDNADAMPKCCFLVGVIVHRSELFTDLGLLRALQATVSAEVGDSEGAVRAVEGLRRMLDRDTERYGQVADARLHLGLEELLAGSVERVCHRAVLSDEQLARLEQAVRVDDGLGHFVACQRGMAIDEFDQPVPRFREHPWGVVKHYALWGTGLPRFEQLQYLRRLKPFVDAARQPYPGRAVEMRAALPDSRWAAWVDVAEMGAGVEGSLRRAQAAVAVLRHRLTERR